VFDSFNEQIASCPLVVGDEQVGGYKVDPTATIRHLLGTVRHQLKRKHRNPITVYGAVRLILAANNPELLRAMETTKEDHDAIVTRFIVLHATSKAADYLNSLGGFDYLEPRWIQGDRIAKHVLHLSITRNVSSTGRRFASEVVETEAHRSVFTSKWAEHVLTWLLDFCMNPSIADAHPQLKNHMRVGDGEFLVNANAMKLLWTSYLPNSKLEPSVMSIGKTLAVLSVDAGRVQKTLPNGDRAWFYPIDVRKLMEFSTEHGYGSTESILRVLNRSLSKAA